MSTADLFDACVNHPMFFYYMTRDKRSKYIQHFADYFNCFRELKKRQPEEVFQLMINYYHWRMLADGKEKDVLKINFFEWLAISGVFDNVLLVDIETFNNIVYENLIKKCSDDNFAGFSYETSLLLGRSYRVSMAEQMKNMTDILMRNLFLKKTLPTLSDIVSTIH